MGKLTDFVMAKKIRELSGEERIKIIREQNRRKMEEVREKLRREEQKKELEQIKQEIFGSDNYDEHTGRITGILSSDILND